MPEFPSRPEPDEPLSHDSSADFQVEAQDSEPLPFHDFAERPTGYVPPEWKGSMTDRTVDVSQGEPNSLDREESPSAAERDEPIVASTGRPCDPLFNDRPAADKEDSESNVTHKPSPIRASATKNTQRRSAGAETGQAATTADDGRGPYPRLTWLMFLMALMLIVRYFVPNVAREIAYGVTQGRQRAQQEFATVALRDSPLAELSRAYQWVSQRVGPSVVHINISGATKPLRAESPDDFAPRYPETRGQGSGVIVDNEGFIVTNQHVIDGAESITVSLGDGRRVRAVVIGVDSLTDLALIRIHADNLIPAEWGDSDDLNVGSLVWAVGSPFGLEQSITSGIVSAKNRSGRAGRTYQDFLQTDAAVNPGNSGGPLVDVEGRLVGINTAIVGDTYRGISFAIPSSVAKDVYQRLKRDGEVARGWVGVQLLDLDADEATQLGLLPRPGAYVAGFVETDTASPGRIAGLLIGDVVIRWNDQEIHNRATLSRIIAQAEVGALAKVIVDRGGEEVKLEVQLSRRPERYN